MEFADSSPLADMHTSRFAREPALRAALRDAALVLQVDGAVSGVNGLGWLAAQRHESTTRRLQELQLQAMTEGWSHEDFVRARLACLRPRRSEMLALGKAYLAALTPGAAEAAHRMRRAGVQVELSGDVAVEALLGVADALGVTPGGIHAPRLRFDALGAYTGCEVGDRAVDVPRTETSPPARVYVGTRTSEQRAREGSDMFVRFTGVVAHEGPGRGETVSGFGELADLVTG